MRSKTLVILHRIVAVAFFWNCVRTSLLSVVADPELLVVLRDRREYLPLQSDEDLTSVRHDVETDDICGQLRRSLSSVGGGSGGGGGRPRGEGATPQRGEMRREEGGKRRQARKERTRAHMVSRMCAGRRASDGASECSHVQWHGAEPGGVTFSLIWSLRGPTSHEARWSALLHLIHVHVPHTSSSHLSHSPVR